jgi:molybdopterin/thiamine biosynthesis adenylyltransferase
MWDKRELERYERQLELIGRRGQQKLKQACVFIAGAGGLGTAVATYLTAVGIGRIEIVDKDTVHISNLNRQVMYSEKDDGKMKAAALARRLRLLNPHIQVQGSSLDIGAAGLRERVLAFDILVDALDNFTSRYALNTAALAQGIPLVHASIRGFYGQLTTLVPGITPCLRCLFPETPAEDRPSVLGPVCGVIGCLQAMEVIKYLLGNGSLLMNKLLVLDALKGDLDEVEIGRRPDCPECGGR